MLMSKQERQFASEKMEGKGNTYGSAVVGQERKLKGKDLKPKGNSAGQEGE